MKKLISILLAVALIASLAGCGASQKEEAAETPAAEAPAAEAPAEATAAEAEDEPIRIAFIGSMTGDDEIYGYVSGGAMEMAVEQINAAGGVADRQIDLHVYDDRGDGVEAVNCARKAILDDKCVAIITASSTTGLISINSVLEEYKVPCIAYAIGAELITKDEQGNTRPYMFRVNTTANQCTTLIGKYAADVLGYSTAAIFYDVSQSTGADGVTYFTNGFESEGGKVVEVEAYNAGDVDFRAQLSKLKSNGGFELIYSAAKYRELGLMANQIKEIGLETQMVGDRSWMMLDVFQVAGDNLEGSIFPSDIDFNDPKYDEFNAEFQERFDVHPGVAVGTDAYCVMDACLVLWNAIEHAVEDTGVISGETIHDAIEKYTTDFEAFTATISISPETHNVRRPMGIFEIRDQNFVLVDNYDVSFG